MTNVQMLMNELLETKNARFSCGSRNFVLGRFLRCKTETITTFDCEVARTSETGWVLRRDPVLVDDGDLKQIHLKKGRGGTCQHRLFTHDSPNDTRAFGVMTIMVFVFTSIQSLLSNVNGSLAIIMIFSRLSAFVILYRPLPEP